MTHGRLRLAVIIATLVLAVVATVWTQHQPTPAPAKMQVAALSGPLNEFQVDFTAGCSAHGDIRSAKIRTLEISAVPKTNAQPEVRARAPQPTSEAERQALIAEKAAAAARTAATRPYALTGTIFGYKGPGAYPITGPSLSADTALRLVGPKGLEVMAIGGTITVAADTANGAMGHLEATFPNSLTAKGAWGCTYYLD